MPNFFLFRYTSSNFFKFKSIKPSQYVKKKISLIFFLIFFTLSPVLEFNPVKIISISNLVSQTFFINIKIFFNFIFFISSANYKFFISIILKNFYDMMNYWILANFN